MDKVVQQNASVSGKVAGTAKELASQSQRLREAVAFFKGSDAASSRAGQPASPVARPAARPASKPSAPADQRPRDKTAPKPTERPTGPMAAKARGAPAKEVAKSRAIAVKDQAADRTDEEFEEF